MEQNTVEWLKWRKGGIGSSDVAVVMGISPWKTPFQLYEEKTDPNDPVEASGNYILEKGKRMEPKIRALLEIDLGRSFSPALVEMEDFTFARASLDGWSEDRSEIAEFKLVGAEAYVETQRGLVPEYYEVQCQWQMLISKAEVCHYACTVNGLAIAHTKVIASPDRQRKILAKAIEFWDKHVLARKPPPFSDSDYQPLRAKGLKSQLQKWKRLKMKITELQDEADAIEDWAKALIDQPRMQAEGVRFTRVQRVGNVNYSAIPQLQGVDLEAYRKPGTEYVLMKIEKA